MSEIRPIAHIYNGYKEKFGIPRQSGRVNDISKIVLEPEYRDPEALRGIDEYSHLWIIFDFTLAHKEGFAPTVRPPRLGGNKRVGVFATRSPFRPNSLGLSSVRLIKTELTEKEGTVIYVSGADILDGTPIYDLKPYVVHSDCHPEAKSSFADEFKDHKLEVTDPGSLLDALPSEYKLTVIQCIADDPRPSYHSDAREYSMRYYDYDISFTVSGNTAVITKIK